MPSVVRIHPCPHFCDISAINRVLEINSLCIDVVCSKFKFGTTLLTNQFISEITHFFLKYFSCCLYAIIQMVAG